MEANITLHSSADVEFGENRFEENYQSYVLPDSNGRCTVCTFSLISTRNLGRYNNLPCYAHQILL